MAPIQTSPFEELAEMRQDVHSVMRQAPGWPLLFPWAAEGEEYFIPATDVVEQGGDLIFRLELPGVDPSEDLTVSVEGRRLQISGQRRARGNEKNESYRLQGMCYGKFDRTFTLQDDIDKKAITADYKDGVLEVRVAGGAKSATAPKGTRIPVATDRSATPPVSKSGKKITVK